MTELLSPAGNLEKLKLAYNYGADAVYVGGRNFSLRANATNFSKEELKEASLYAKSLNKKIYVTVNIVFHDKDFDSLEEYLLYLDEIKIDAIIVSDISVLELSNKLNLKLERHLSTQASLYNYEAALFYESLGVTRVVMARESTKEDIISIKENTNLEIETFIHGAMCISFSGKCIMSNYETNRDSNRGGCAQICRWNYEFYNNDNLLTKHFQISSKDLNMSLFLKEMLEIQIDSLKIEGRMRSLYYIATVIHTYRRLIDKIKKDSLTEKEFIFYNNILNSCSNRETAPQFFQKNNINNQYYLKKEENSNQDFLGIVVDNKDGIITIEERNYFEPGTTLQFFGSGYDYINYKPSKLYDEELNEIEKANVPLMLVKIKADLDVYKGDMIRAKRFDF